MLADLPQEVEGILLVDAESPMPSSSSRTVCARCARPHPVACLCEALPHAPLAASRRVIVLTHPAEMKRSLTSTSQLLGLLLERAVTIVGRIFREGEHPVLDEALAQRDTLLLFPRSGAFELPTPLGTTHGSDGGTGDMHVRLEDHVRRSWLRKDAEERAAALFPAPSAPVTEGHDADAPGAEDTVKIARRQAARQRRQLVEDLLREEEQSTMGPVSADSPKSGSGAGRDRFLIALDGTWTEVSRLLNQNDRLKTWPVCIKLPEEVRVSLSLSLSLSRTRVCHHHFRSRILLSV